MTPDGHGVNCRKLQILFQSTALRTLWDGNIAIGVEYLHEGKTKKVFARKGVVVCAGLFSSPFLMHSGIGPASLLNSLNIPVKFDNPNVGQNLTDQIQVLTSFTSNPNDFPKYNPNSLFDQIAWLPAPGKRNNIRRVRFATTTVVPGITLGVVDILLPKSRGSIVINSADPLAPPVIDYGFYSNQEDLELYVRVFQTYIKSINNAFKAIDPLYQLIAPDPAILDDPVLLREYIKEATGSNLSYLSHCRMAPLDDGGVVDNRGRVHGVKRLYVADNSIAPFPMDGATMASAYLISTNVALMIKNEK